MNRTANSIDTSSFRKVLSNVISKLPPSASSLVVPSLLTFFAGAALGTNGGITFILLAPLISVLIFLRLSKKKRSNVHKFSLTALFAGISLGLSYPAAVLGELVFRNINDPVAGAKTRSYANKVIATATTSKNSENLRREVEFLLSMNQEKWLNASQVDLLKKKLQHLSSVSSQVKHDELLTKKASDILSSPITLQNYKAIIDQVSKVSADSRFSIVISEANRKRIRAKGEEAAQQGKRLKAEKEAADLEKAKVADYDAYLEAMTEIRKNLTSAVSKEMDSRGITYDNENDPMRLQVIEQVEAQLKPGVYDSAPKTLTPSQVDSIWSEIQAQVRSNL